MEGKFHVAVNAKINPGVILQTNKQKYDDSQNRDEVIGYRVLNLSAVPIYFSDDGFNIQAYKYIPNEQKWLHLQMGVGWEPKLTTIQPGPPEPLSGVNALLRQEIPSTGSIRLVVIGWNDPKNPEGSRFAAFKDIELTP